MKMLHKYFFLNTLMLSTMISVSSISWFTAWMGLEINLLSMITLMKNNKNKFSTEASMKYFIVQAMASSLLLFSILLFMNSNNMKFVIPSDISLLTNTALMMKMGAAPFHFWLPEVVSGMKWNMIFILLTWQKIAPMILLFYSTYLPLYLSIIIILSSLISGIQGLNQTCIRKIMAYSSINHVSWMIASIITSLNTWTYYFIIYSLINYNIMSILNMHNIFYINQMNKLFSQNKKMKFFFMMNFLSLGGLPPFLGFLPKWISIHMLIKNNFLALSLLLIILSLISLYFYIRITLTSLTFNKSESIMKFFKITKFMNLLINFIALLSLFSSILLTKFF
uniref:NADH-ubiquinone oxidoreductase chain 2 n=2 Tax=unclassified Curculionoidea TaxID=201752 RepID=A0A346RIT4_9CUCU|nr:NADH dehydrogenase subunit 2 [Curculionoidea sp. 6 KM-2017]AXS65991.1 NADH dehydrogenase subunit 2 [Curculionoidea sp. 5 KM-2017]